MPICSRCGHAGGKHAWRMAPRSSPDCACLRHHPQRLRAACLMAGCPCLKYGPRTDSAMPLNRYIGKARRG